jgi:ABC-type uncharacterized transport system involved in gliding motility auxiliary subunit
MKTIATKNYWKYLFWLGPILAVMGLSAAVVSGKWSSVPLALLIAGIVLSGLWLLFQARETNWWSRRSTQAGTNAIVATLAVLVILGLVNFLGTRYPVRVDFTETGLFTLAPQSQQLVQNLQQPIKVWIFDRNQNPQDRQLLENYQRQGQNFSFEYVDPQAQPGLAQKFGVKNPGEVYLEAGKRRQLLQTVNQEERLSEVRLTNGLQQITSNRTSKVYFLQGHGERPFSDGQGGLSQASSFLGGKNYTTEPLNLVQQPAVPKDATVLVVAGPKRSLFKQEIKALSDYLNQGGSLLLMIDPNTNPGLDSLLKNWGVQLENGLAVDASGLQGFGPAVPVVDQYGEHPITKDFGNGISFYPLAQPIDLVPVPGVEATPLLITTDQSWAESNIESKDLQFNPESDRQGPLTLGVALSRKVKAPSNSNQSGDRREESRLVVLGNSTFATDGVIEQQLNGDVFLNSVSWLSKQDEQLLSIRPKEAKNRRINLKPQQANILSLAALGLVPLLGFGTAVILWWKRR